ncbi:MAG TPA: nitrate- and nitrite sensing domain-containing protein [Rhodocyclaceae bacterium]
MRLKLGFADLSIKTKLAFAIAIPTLALTLMIGKTALEGWRQVGQLQIVESDAALLVTAGGLIHQLQRERGISELYLGEKGDARLADMLRAQRGETDKHFADFRAALDGADPAKIGDAPMDGLRLARRQIEAALAKRGEISDLKMAPLDVLKTYEVALGAMVSAEQKLRHEREQVDADVANVARAYVNLVDAKEKAGAARAAGVIGFEAGHFAPDVLQVFAARAAEMRRLLAYVQEIATPADQLLLQTKLAGKDVAAVNDAIAKVVQAGAGAPVALTGEEWFRAATVQADRLKEVEDAYAAELGKVTAERVAAIQRLVAAELGFAVLLVLAVTALAVMVYRGIARSVNNLLDTVRYISAGQYDVRARIYGTDELGMLALTLNEMLDDRVQALAKAQQENETLNNSVVELLKAVYALSQRDLTTRCEVDATIIGTVADSINQLTGETAKVLAQVSRAARRVGGASEKVKLQAGAVSQVAEAELQSVDAMTEGIAGTVEQIDSLAQLATETNRSAGEAAASTNEALERVSDTVKGMESIRETIAETEKRIKRLGERSQEISGIVNLINTISERTHVLALNASMQAAIAGEAGRGFAVVAEEVQRLAESSRNATSQIATLVNNIQIETNDTVATVNRTIGQVVSESELARKAGEQMEKTQHITLQLADMVRLIAENTQQQTRSAQMLRQQVERIEAGAKQTRDHIVQQTEEAQALDETARHLLGAISVFTLPEQIAEAAAETLTLRKAA